MFKWWRWLANLGNESRDLLGAGVVSASLRRHGHYVKHDNRTRADGTEETMELPLCASGGRRTPRYAALEVLRNSGVRRCVVTLKGCAVRLPQTSSLELLRAEVMRTAGPPNLDRTCGAQGANRRAPAKAAKGAGQTMA